MIWTRNSSRCSLRMNNMCRAFSFCCHSRRGPEKVFPLAPCHGDTKDRCGKLVFSNTVVMVTHDELRRRPECLAWFSRPKVLGLRKLNSDLQFLFKNVKKSMKIIYGTYINTIFRCRSYLCGILLFIIVLKKFMKI